MGGVYSFKLGYSHNATYSASNAKLFLKMTSSSCRASAQILALAKWQSYTMLPFTPDWALYIMPPIDDWTFN